MVDYPFINDLFTEILSNSRAIQGKFYVGYRYGLQEVNYEQLGEVLGAIKTTSKFPLVIMAPPHSQTVIGGRSDGWEEYRLFLFFCKQSLIEDIAVDTKTSQHTVMNDWHDMKRAALNFLRALRNVQNSTKPATFRLPTHKALIIPFSNIGNDRVAGIQINFDFEVWIGCETEDYDEYPKTLKIEPDSHPEHSL